MKSQTDMIVSIVAVLLALIMAGVFYGTKRQVLRPPAPTVVDVKPPQYPAGSVSYANAIPGGRVNSVGSMGRAGGGGGAGVSMGGAIVDVSGASQVGGGGGASASVGQ